MRTALMSVHVRILRLVVFLSPCCQKAVQPITEPSSQLCLSVIVGEPERGRTGIVLYFLPFFVVLIEWHTISFLPLNAVATQPPGATPEAIPSENGDDRRPDSLKTILGRKP